MERLTFKKLKNICNENKFIALRYYYSDRVIGFNCAVLKLGMYKKTPPSKKTRFVSYQPISFGEYIRIKVPFIYSNSCAIKN